MNILFEKNRLTPEDYIALRPEIPIGTARKAIDGSSMTLRAVADGETVGMLRVLSDGAMFCYIQDVFVFENYRGQGLGRALLEQAMCSMGELLEMGEYMLVTLLADPGMEEFYEHMGFMRAPNALAGHAMQCILQKD